jgi:hypothetical protein
MARVISGLACAAILLAGCGGGGPSAPGLPGGDYKGKMPDAMKPCDEANKATTAALPGFRSGKASLNETKATADAGVAACEASYAAWKALHMPPEVVGPCMAQAQAKLNLAHALRTALDHLISKPYKSAIDRQVDAVARETAACKKAMS